MKDAIAHLYDVFAPYGLNVPLSGCSHCIHDADQEALAVKPLRELGSADLSRFAFKSMTTWGAVEDFKHFLPRLFELLAYDERAGTDLYPDVLLSKLDYGGWKEWPTSERAATHRYLEALWDRVLGQYPFHIGIGDLVWGTARTGVSMDSFLSRWLNIGSATAARHLVDLIGLTYPTLSKKDRFNESLVPEEQQECVRTWLLSEPVASYMEQAFFKFSEADFAAELSNASQQLLWLRQDQVASPSRYR